MDKLDRIWLMVKEVAVVILIIVGAFYIHMYQVEKGKREQAEIAAKGLPPDVLAQYTIENRRLIEQVKNAQGKTEVKTFYVPDEGKVTVVTKERDAAIAKYNDLLTKLKVAKSTEDIAQITGQMTQITQELNTPPKIDLRYWGLTSRFGFGLVASPGHTMNLGLGDGTRFNVPVSPEIDWKFFYWKRYSALIQANAWYGGPMITRHVDDFTPEFLHANNIELGVSGGPGWTGGYGVGINTRANW